MSYVECENRVGLTIVTAAAATPISVAELKSHSRISTSADDTLIGDYINAATALAQDMTNRQFVNATLKMTYDRFPAEFRPLRAPLVSVSSITYLDDAGASQTVSAGDYRVVIQFEPGIVEPAYGLTWPAQRYAAGSVAITYIAGYGAAGANVPQELRQLVKLIAAHWYEHREPTLVGTINSELPQMVVDLASKWYVSQVIP